MLDDAAGPDETEQLSSRLSQSGNAGDSTAETGEPAHDRFRRSAATILVSALDQAIVRRPPAGL